MPILEDNKTIIDLSVSTSINEICAPLKNLNITFFSYTRIYKNGARIDLNTHAEMADIYYLKDKLYISSAMEGNSTSLNEGLILWSTIEDDESIKLARAFNIANGITIVQKHNQYDELWHFGSTPQNTSIINFYLNNLNMLKLFSYHFKDRGSDLIEKVLKNHIKIVTTNLPQNDKQNLSSFLSVSNNENTSLSVFEKQLDIQRYYLGDRYLDNYLTKREVDCLRWQLEGKSAEEIAMIFKITKRTVETHLHNIKQKLGCYKQSQLVKKAIDLGFV